MEVIIIDINQRIMEKIKMNNTVVAKDYEYLLNPDFLKRSKIKEDIKLNDGYCLSKPQSEDTKCICKEFKEQESFGFCKCGLYYKILKCIV